MLSPPISIAVLRRWLRPNKTFHIAHDLVRKTVPTFRDHTLCRCALPAAADDELKIAQIDEHAERLPNDEHRVLTVECVAEQHQAAADREHPERGWHHAAPGPLRGDP